MLVVGARLKARNDQALSIGWYGAALDRQKTLKPLAEMLAPRRSGNARALEMFRRLAARSDQGTANGDG